MGLKGYMLWVMGQFDSKRRAPLRVGGLEALHVVALQVAFERQTLKPIFSLDRL
jgi:hypothetical protein